MANFTISEIYINYNPTHQVVNNVLLDDREYTFIRGLLHVDFNVQKAILFTDSDYTDIKYSIQRNLHEIIKEFNNSNYIYSEDIYIIHIPSMISNINDTELCHIDPFLQHRIGINFRTVGFDIIYNNDSNSDYFLSGNNTNIIERVRNISVETIKNDLGNSIISLTNNIKTYCTNMLNNVLYDDFYNLIPYKPLNLTSSTIKFLNYIKTNQTIIDAAKDQLEIFKKLNTSFLSTISSTNTRNRVIRITHNFNLRQTFNKQRRSNELIYKFDSVLFAIEERYNSDRSLLFIACYLMYLKEYEKITAYFKNQIVKAF